MDATDEGPIFEFLIDAGDEAVHNWAKLLMIRARLEREMAIEQKLDRQRR
ncbi:MAG: hypothetical protein AAGJ28_05165 [Pseudomonadota bacterium]